MMRAVAPFLEKHHGVMISDDALRDSVRLSHRYLTARQLPDKSVSVLDTACARVAIGLSATPPAVEAATRRIAEIERETKILKRESIMGQDHDARLASLAQEKEATASNLEALNRKWQAEMEIATRIQALQKEVHQA